MLRAEQLRLRSADVENPAHTTSKAIPLRPTESIDVEADERTSELGLNALPATPPSEPPLAQVPRPLTSTVAPIEPIRVGTMPSLAEEMLAEEALVDTTLPAVAEAPAPQVVQTPPRPHHSGVEMTSFEQQVLAQMGPEFQTQVMNLVAERVAQIVAERMLESLGGGVTSKPQPIRASRSPQVRKASVTTETPSITPKAGRRKTQVK